MRTTRTRNLWLLLAVAPSAVMAAAWALHSGHMLFGGPADLAGAIGNLCALVGLPLLVMMVLLGTRFQPVERQFGLDRMLRLHKMLGTLVVVLFTTHAGLRFLRASLVAGGEWQWAVFFSFQGGGAEAWGMNLARLALPALLAAGGMARMGAHAIPFFNLPFRLWKPPHLLLYIAVPLGLAHAFLKGDDMAGLPYVFIWAAAVAFFVMLAAGRLRCIVLRAKRCTFTLQSSTAETPEVTTLRFARPEGPGEFARRRPGQFCVVRRIDRPWSEPRPFTLSGGSDGDTLRCSIKRGGTFTRTLTALPPETRLLCEGPYGVFVPDVERERNLVLIAGGIGVTPFLSLLRSLPEDCPAGIILIWNTRSAGDIFAADELAALTVRQHLKVVYVLSRDIQLPGEPADGPIVFERGHVTAGLLRRHVQPDGASWYLCGPQRMQRFVLDELHKAFHVRPRQVRRELFFW
jgi:predicted ferric reductase